MTEIWAMQTERSPVRFCACGEKSNSNKNVKCITAQGPQANIDLSFQHYFKIKKNFLDNNKENSLNLWNFSQFLTRITLKSLKFISNPLVVFILPYSRINGTPDIITARLQAGLVVKIPRV